MASNNISENPENDATYLGYDTDKSLLNNHDGHDHHNHTHDHDEKSMGCIKSKSSKLISMLIMVFSFFLMEALVGQITNSLTLLADSFHMLSDALALIVGLVAVTYSKRRSNEYLKPWFSRNKYSNTFGWVRFEVVGALVNATFLLALCLSIAMEAIEKFMKPQLPTDPQLVLIVGGSGLVVNLLGLCLFGGHVGHSHDHPQETKSDQESQTKPKKQHHHHHDQMNMRAVFLHVLGDALGSVVVVMTALIYIFVPHKAESSSPNPNDTSTLPSGVDGNNTTCCVSEEELVTMNKWILYIDPAMSLILVIILCVTTIPLFKQSGLILMQSVPIHIDIDDLKKKFENIPGIAFIHDFHIWQLAGEKMIATIHIQVKDQEAYQRVAVVLKTQLCEVGIHSLTIQPEFGPLQTQSCYMDCNAECDKNGVVADGNANNKMVEPSTSNNSQEIQMQVRQPGTANMDSGDVQRRGSGDSQV